MANRETTQVADRIFRREIVSSVSFQMLLYYNFLFSVAYFFVSVFVLRWKILNYTDFLTTKLFPVLFSIWSGAELYRLYLGYAGNLQEKVPHLAGFMFLTIFPQTVLAVLFLMIQKRKLPVDRIFAYCHIVFIALELIVGYRAINRIIDNKTARFAVEFGKEQQEQHERENATLLTRRNAPDSSDDYSRPGGRHSVEMQPLSTTTTRRLHDERKRE